MPRFATVPLLLAAVALAAPRGAGAHAILVRSAPPVGGAVAAGPVAMEFRFNSRIDRARSRLVITGPDNAPRTLAIIDDGPPDLLRATATLAPGAYEVRWQVLAVDGHITRGDVPFSVTGP